MLRFGAAAQCGRLCAGRVGDSIAGRASGLERAWALLIGGGAIHSCSLPEYLKLGSEIGEGHNNKRIEGKETYR